MAKKSEKVVKTTAKGTTISSVVQKNIETHKKAALHHENAAKYHLEAAKFHALGNHEKAHQSSVIAVGHSIEAHDLQKEDMKNHAAE